MVLLCLDIKNEYKPIQISVPQIKTGSGTFCSKLKNFVQN